MYTHGMNGDREELWTAEMLRDRQLALDAEAVQARAEEAEVTRTTRPKTAAEVVAERLKGQR
jgi:hypothetical protein